MADSIVSVFVDKLGPLIIKEAAFLHGVEDQLILLRNQLEWIKSFLREAQQKRRESHMVEVWVTQIIDLAYDAEDVVDAYILHVELQRRRNLIQKAMHFGKKVLTLHQLGNRIEEINIRAQRISACRLNYAPDVSNSTQVSASKKAENMAYRRRGIDTFGESDIVGFKGEQTKLAGQLKDAEAFPSRKVISIQGMGGLGKTTLARVVYNHVSDHFMARVWITVSQKYDAKDLLLTALKDLPAHEDQGNWAQMDYNQLEKEVRKRLEGKRYLVVIDDIWNVEDWERISIAFPNSKKGSRIILTTRNEEVALHASREHRLELRLLNEDERWVLFCRKVFSESGGACPGDLAKVGKEIVQKCGGLPLAIVVIGGLLMGKERTESAWRKVCDSAKWHLSQDSNLCRETLSWSYNNLPHYLKSCFLYLGLFPEDYEIQAERLILYWVAEGFVQPRGEEKIEDVAEDYLEELIQRSMIQVAQRMYLEGPVVSCRIHDLLRDLAVSEGRKYKFMNCHSSNKHYVMSSDAKFRRFAIHSTTGDEHQDQIYHTVITINPHLRSLLLFQRSEFSLMAPNGLIPCNMLRVLDMGDAQLSNKDLPKEIGNLFLLHYLRLSGSDLTCLPNSIGKLVNLQTLDLGETGLETLPETIWKLKNLRHMYLNRGCKMSGLCRLNDFGRNLLTLKVGHHVLVEMSNVLVKAEYLRTLILNSSWKSSMKCFPLSLVHLTIDGFSIRGFPLSLPNLKSLRLINLYALEVKMIFGREQFSQLEYLELRFIDGENIEWRVEDGGLSSLRDLKIYRCRFLKKLPDGLKSVTSLQRITVRRMPLGFTERLKENGEHWDIIKHVPTIDIRWI